MKKNLKFALLQTSPVFFGYLFLGAAFGLMLQKAGYSFIWAFFCSLFIYAGSGQFLLVGLLSSGVNLITIAAMTLVLNSRHIFYGLSFIERFKKMGKACTYMIFSLTDETYSLLCFTTIPKELDEKKTTLLIALLNQAYWIFGGVVGALLGELLRFDSSGVEFAMTALFTVICLEQWLGSKSHLPAIIGFISGTISLIVFGPEHFILPSLICTVGILLLSKKYLEPYSEELNDAN